MKKLTFSAIVIAVVLVPTWAFAQVPLDLTEEPEKDLGGPFPSIGGWQFAWLILLLGLIMLAAVVLGHVRWAPTWVARRGRKPAAPVPSIAPAIADVIDKPGPSLMAEAAAAASAVSIGEQAHAVEPGAVPVVDEHSADASSGGDVYQETLDELLAKGVPQKVAEARAKVAAKKAGG